MRFSKGDLVKNTKAPAWGIGEVLDSLGYYVHVIFEEVDERRAFVREDNPLKKVDSPEGVANLKNKSRTKIYGGKSTEERVRRDKKNAQAAKNLADKELKSFSKVTFKPDITGHYLILAGLLIHLTQIIMLICKQFFMILFTLDGSRQGGVRGYWADEATEKTASKPKFREINLHLHKLIGLVYLTDELMEDKQVRSAYEGED